MSGITPIDDRIPISLLSQIPIVETNERKYVLRVTLRTVCIGPAAALYTLNKPFTIKFMKKLMFSTFRRRWLIWPPLNRKFDRFLFCTVASDWKITAI